MRIGLAITGTIGLLIGPPASASDYGCKVLLCLANPNGARAVSECRPPIDQLFTDLARGRPFPTCDLAQSSSGTQSWAQQGLSYYDPCPTGTTALANGMQAVQGTPLPPINGYGSYYSGIGDGDGQSPASGESYSPMPGKVCVGNHIGTTSVSSGSGESFETMAVGVYDRVVLLDAQRSPNVIDVYVDSSLYRRVRW